MKKKTKKAPFPIYCVSEFQRPANCDEGENCNPAEYPSHHVLINLSSEAREVIETIAECLEETHADEVAARHHGDKGGASTCSYCKAIKNARLLLKYAEEK